MTITSNPAIITISNCNDFSFQKYNDGLFLSTAEIAIVKARTICEPWKSAYDRLVTESNTAFNDTNIPSIMDGSEPSGWDPHKFYSEGTSSTTRTDYNNAQKIRNYVRNLGLRYALSNESDKNKYANKVISIIKKWCLDSSTWMRPQQTGSNSTIEIMITMPGMLYGVQLTWGYSGWDTTNVLYGGTNTTITAREAMKKWASSLLDNYIGTAYGDAKNYRFWRQALVCTCAIISGRTDKIQHEIDDWKAYFPSLVDTDGSIFFERSRHTTSCSHACDDGCCGISYSGSGIRAMITVAEIARHRNVDLYSWTDSRGMNLIKALDFHAPFYNKSPDWYQTNTTEWPYCRMDGGWPNKCFVGQATDIFEIGYSMFRKSAYKDAVKRWGRNSSAVYDERTMGNVTLTHGSRFPIP